MEKNNENHALHITDKAKHSTYKNCYIEGVKDEGYKTTMNETTIVSFKKKHPNVWKGGMISLFITVVGGVILLLFEYGVLR